MPTFGRLSLWRACVVNCLHSRPKTHMWQSRPSGRAARNHLHRFAPACCTGQMAQAWHNGLCQYTAAPSQDPPAHHHARHHCPRHPPQAAGRVLHRCRPLLTMGGLDGSPAKDTMMATHYTTLPTRIVLLPLANILQAHGSPPWWQILAH